MFSSDPLCSLAYLATYFVDQQRLDSHIGTYSPSKRLDLYVASAVVLLCWALTWTSERWENHCYVPPIQRYDDELIVVTGGASGIGLCTARLLAEKGAKVIIIDVQGLPKSGLANEKTSAIHSYKCDLSSADALGKVARSIRYMHGSPTILINNAGMTHSQPITTLSAAQVAQLVTVNLTAQMWTIQEFLPDMIAAAKSNNRASHIVSTASVMGHIGTSQMIDYCASKHGVIGLHKALRYELDYCHRCPEIRTTLVVLGHVRTTLFQGLPFNALARFLGPSVKPERVAARIVRSVERRRGGTIALPWYANWTEALSLLPSWARDFVHWLLGANTSMAEMHIARKRSA